jgi:hypothetical protein
VVCRPYFTGGTYRIVRANSQHRKNTTGICTASCRIPYPTISRPFNFKIPSSGSIQDFFPPRIASFAGLSRSSNPAKIVFFKKEACDTPTPQGFRCTFDVKIASRNLGASMYNNISFGFFYKDKESGKWGMRPPF